jgi:hypothetical protein
MGYPLQLRGISHLGWNVTQSLRKWITTAEQMVRKKHLLIGTTPGERVSHFQEKVTRGMLPLRNCLG